MLKKIHISPSLLSADLLRLGEEITSVTQAGADFLHIDIMDGHYVPNLSFGQNIVSSVAKVTSLPLDVHLMIAPSAPYLHSFVQAGARYITIHPDADIHTQRLLTQIRSYGAKAGVALNPATPLNILDHLLPFLDIILVMTVNPGFPGQEFIPEMLEKISQVRQRIDQSGLPILLEVDGGINAKTAPQVIKVGADVLVAGAAIFSTETPFTSSIDRQNHYKNQIERLRGDPTS